MLIQNGPESSEGDSVLAIASKAAVPQHMKLALVEMNDQERMDRCAVTCGCASAHKACMFG